MTKKEYETSLILIQALLHCYPSRIEDILSMNPELVKPDLLSVIDEVIGNLLQLGMVDRANCLRDCSRQIRQQISTDFAFNSHYRGSPLSFILISLKIALILGVVYQA